MSRVGCVYCCRLKTIYALSPAQHGRFSSTTRISSAAVCGFAEMRCPSMRRASRASSGVISDVTKTIGTLCNAQSPPICVASSTPSISGMTRSTSRRSGLKLRAVSNACSALGSKHTVYCPVRCKIARAPSAKHRLSATIKMRVFACRAVGRHGDRRRSAVGTLGSIIVFIQTPSRRRAGFGKTMLLVSLCSTGIPAKRGYLF